MDDQHSISRILQPVMDNAVTLAREFATPEEALRAVREVEVAVGLATDLLMREYLVQARG